MKLLGKIAIVTGGGTGIGKATALLLAAEGAKVIICGRRWEPLETVVHLIQERGGEAFSVKTDMRDWKQVEDMVNAVLNQFGQVNILVNNAGTAIPKPVVELTEAEWNETLDTNLKSVFLGCKAVLPNMIERNEGVIVNVSSTLGKTGLANFGAYCASKFGIIGLTQALADENKTKNVHVYSVCPGRTNTDMQRYLGGDTVAMLSMPPEKVALKICGLVTGNISSSSGKEIIINDQSFQMFIYEVRRIKKWEVSRLKMIISPQLNQIKKWIKNQI